MKKSLPTPHETTEQLANLEHASSRDDAALERSDHESQILSRVVEMLPSSAPVQQAPPWLRYAPSCFLIVTAVILAVYFQIKSPAQSDVTTPDREFATGDRYEIARSHYQEAIERFEDGKGWANDNEDKIEDALMIAASAWESIHDARYPKGSTLENSEFRLLSNRIKKLIERAKDELEEEAWDQYVDPA